MTNYLLDTSVIISYLRDTPHIAERIDNLKGMLSSSYICMAELWEGVMRSTNPDKTGAAIADFFHGLDDVYGVDEVVAQQFGSIRARLKRQGNVIEDLDILIAATCATYNLTLVTSNPKHFQRVEHLRILAI